MYILVHRFKRIWLSQVLMLKWLSTSGRRYIESRPPLHWCKILFLFGCLLGCLWVLNGRMLIQMFKADFKMHFCNAVKKYARIQCTSNQCSALCGGHLWSFDVCAESIIFFTMFLLFRWNQAPSSLGSSLISKSFGKMNFFPKQFFSFQGFQKVVV